MDSRSQFMTTILGAILMLLPCACHLYWGNLSMYTFSYILATNTASESVIGAPWFMTLFNAMWLSTLSLGGLVVKVVGRRTVLMLSALTFNVSLFMCYFIIDTSALTLMLYLGLVGGVSVGLPHGLIMEITTEVAPKGRVGIVSVIVQNATNLGAAVINQFITIYINPNYLASNWKFGPNAFFSQDVIIERVPSVYLCLGIGSSMLQFAGICLMWKYCSKGKTASFADLEMQMNIPEPQTTEGFSLSVPSPNAKIKMGNKNKSNKTEKDPILHNDDLDEMKTIPTFVQSPLECVKFCLHQRRYYILLTLSTMVGICFGIVPSYYKEIGRRGIDDEAWLTSIGSISLITTIPISLLNGFVFDRFGAKRSLLFLISVMAVLLSFYCITPFSGVCLYFLTTILMLGMLNSVDFILTPSIVPALGGDNFCLKLGLVRSPCVLLLPCLTSLVSFIIRTYDYSFLFTCLSTGQIACILLILFY